MRTSCQTRALVPDESGQGARPDAASVPHGQRNTSLCSALLYARGLKPSLATTNAKASRRVIAVPLGLEAVRPALGHVFLFPALLYASGLIAEYSYDERKGFSPRDRGLH
ncbi:MAG TPA: hypothetical protein VFC58_05420 [Desulfosporosinus sp.]|nr:hypothetical protein [Desulfosporosinus sp.]